MSNNFGFIDIILLAMIAGFIILRLRNILGKKTGHEGKTTSRFDEKNYSQFKPEIKSKSIIKDSLEGSEKSLQESIEKYNRMMHLNNYIQEQFREKSKEISNSNVSKKIL